jgi:hypothetical protein
MTRRRTIFTVGRSTQSWQRLKTWRVHDSSIRDRLARSEPGSTIEASPSGSVILVSGKETDTNVPSSSHMTPLLTKINCQRTDHKAVGRKSRNLPMADVNLRIPSKDFVLIPQFSSHDIVQHRKQILNMQLNTLHTSEVDCSFAVRAFCAGVVGIVLRGSTRGDKGCRRIHSFEFAPH